MAGLLGVTPRCHDGVTPSPASALSSSEFVIGASDQTLPFEGSPASVSDLRELGTTPSSPGWLLTFRLAVHEAGAAAMAPSGLCSPVSQAAA